MGLHLLSIYMGKSATPVCLLERILATAVIVHQCLGKINLIPESAEDLWLATTKAPRPYTDAVFTPSSWLFFGKETAGLPAAFRERFPERCIRLPMIPGARSLNLSNSVAVLVYEALRQTGFPGLCVYPRPEGR